MSTAAISDLWLLGLQMSKRLSIATLVLVTVPTGALSQIVEENPAPLVFGEQGSSIQRQPSVVASDDTPIGVDLKQLVVIDKRGESAPDEAWRGQKVDLSKAGEELQDADIQERLQSFVGQPLSFKLIDQVRFAISQHYSSLGRPFLDVVAPPQEITGGILIVEVIEFRAGELKVEGNRWTSTEHILDNIRLNPGEVINVLRLSKDVDWLNLNPYRKLNAVFEPGTIPGTTDVVLQSKERFPLSANFGYANSGSLSSGTDRVFAGINTGNLPLVDHQLSYLGTFSPESLRLGEAAGVTSAPGYASHALSYFAPVSLGGAARAKLQIAAGYVTSGSELNEFFHELTESWVLSADLIGSLDLADEVTLEPFVGVDVKRQFSEVYFIDTIVSKSNNDLAQYRTGAKLRYSHASTEFQSLGTLEGWLTFSPLGSSTNGASHEYAYGSFRHTTRHKSGAGVSLSAAGQTATRVLPDFEKISIGGASSIRGYQTSEASGDQGAYGSLEIYAPPIRLPVSNGFDLAAEGYAFWDVGQVWRNNNTATDLQSIGLGMDIRVGQYLAATLEAGHALTNASITRKGDVMVHGSVAASF